MTRTVSVRLAVEDDEKVKAALRSMGTAGAEALAIMERGASRSAQSFRQLEQALDPAARAQAQMAAAQVRLNQALEAGHINAQRAAELTALARQRYLDAGQAATQMAAGADRAAHAVRGLGIQSIDVFQQLATGAPVMTTFIQQGSQVAQQSAAMGVSLGTVARGAAAAVAAYAPLIAALGAVAAVGGAAYAVFSRSNELASQQRTLSVAIQGVGRSAELSSVALRGYVRDLERQGVASAEALKSVADLSRNSALPPAMVGRIVGLGPDAAAALGSSVPDAIERMARAAKGTTDAIQDLSDAFNLLTPAEEASVRRMVEHGERGESLQVVFDKLQQRVQGLSRDALSPAEQAMRDMSNAWGGFIDRVAGSDLVVGAIERIAAGLRTISGLMGSGGGNASDAGSIDAQIAALSGAIPGTNATAARLRREQTEALSRLYVQRQAAAQAAADAVEFGGGIPPAGAPLSMPSAAGILGTPTGTRSREIDRRAADVVAGTTGGTITRLTQHLREYQAELTAIQRGSDEWAARAPTLQAAIEATNKAIEDAQKKGEQHLDTLEKARAAYASQTRAQEELTAAHARGRDAVAQVLATREAEAKALEANLIPGTARYAAAVADLTTRIQARQQAEASAKVAERVQEANEAVEAQLRINAAYDGTEASVIRAQNAEKALAEARRAGLSPNGAGFADQVGAIASAYDRAADASRAFQQAQSSVGAILGSIENAADRVGQALVDGFINGRNEAVTAASVARAAFSSLAADAAKLGLINPLVNSVLGTNRPTLWTGLNALSGGAVGGAAAAGNGGNGLFGSLGNAMSLGRLSDALGLTDFGNQLSGVGRFLGISGNNGLFSGVSSLLNTPLWGHVAGIEAATAAQIAGATGPAGLFSEAAAAGNMGLASGLGTPGVTIGDLLGGVGLGFGAGSLLGGVLQRTFNRTGPAPTIGAGLGAGAGALIGSFIPGVGTLLGGLAGGLFGGSTGSLIGPRPATPFSATGLNADASGLLSVGRTVSQIVDTTAEVAALTEQVQRVNAILAAGGARIANAVSTDEFSQARIVGGTSGTWLNFGQGGGRPGSLVDAFGELRFTANDPNVAAAVSGRAFGSLDDLAKVLDQIGKATSFLDDLVPTLTDLTERSTQFSDALKAVNDTYAEAITFARETAQVEGLSAEMAGRLRQAETDLIAARETASLKAVDAVLASVAAPLGSVPAQLKDIADSFNAAIADIQKSVGSSAAVTERLQQAEQALVEARDRRAQQVYDEAARSIYDYDASLNVRLANVTAEPGAARLFAADEQARLERQALDKTLVDQWGEAIRQTQAYADQFALLNQVLSAERGALERQNAEAVRRRTEDATDITRGLGVRITTANAALGFDEAAYLRANPDVARQVAAGAIASGWSHYQQYGRMEGRTGGAVSDMDARRATFDEQARLERQALDRQLVGLWGEQVRTTAGYTEQLANLNQALAAEWRAIEQQVANDNTSWRRSVYDPLIADTSPAGRLATEIETLTRSFAEAAEKARTLGLSEDALALARDRQIQGARDRMDLQGLQLIGRQQGVLTSFLDDLAFGPAVSPTDRLRASQDAFASAVAQARAGDVRTADLGAVTAAATRLLEAGRGFYATGPGQNSLEQMVRSTVESLGRTLDLPAFGGDIERSLRAAINPLTDELDALRQEVRELRTELTTRRVLGVAA